MRRFFTGTVALMLLMAVLIGLTGCASYINSLRAELEGKPLWIYQNPAATLQDLFYVGSGTSTENNEDLAREIALEGVLNDISAFLKFSINDTYRREFITTFGIEELGVKIMEEFRDEGPAGELVIYLLASADRKIISQMVRDNLETSRAQTQLIDQPMRQAESSYSRKDDFAALEYYAKAAVEAYTSRLEGAAEQYNSIVSRMISIVEAITIEVTQNDPATGTVTLVITRGTGFFAPKLSGIPIRAEFPIKNSQGRVSYSSTDLVTGSNGRLDFVTNHPGFRGSGHMTFYFDLQDIVKDMERVIGTENTLMLELRSALAEKFVKVPFALISQTAGKSVALSLLEFNEAGVLLESHAGLDRMVEMMGKDGIQANPLYFTALSTAATFDYSDQQVLMKAKEAFGGLLSVCIAGSVGISSQVKSGSNYIVTVRGSVSAYLLDTNRKLAATDQLVANGTGANWKAAEQAAFSRFGELAAYQIVGLII